MVIGPSRGYANTSGSVTHTPSPWCQDIFSGSSVQPGCLKLLNGERIKSPGHAAAAFEVAVISIISLQRETHTGQSTSSSLRGFVDTLFLSALPN